MTTDRYNHKMGKYVIRTSCDGFNFIMVSEEEVAILTSEIYSTLQDCKCGITQVRANCSYDGRYVLEKTDDCKFYFLLKSQNGQFIGISEIFDTVLAMQQVIASCKRNGVSNQIIEVIDSEVDNCISI